jgi:dipeptidyl aminopeptidase/acylaminoacyl peptidase
VNAGEVDAKRLCIDGRSAGGYTTMAALVFSDTFTAGATLFGLSDLTVFVTETHKFESRYLDSLIGSTDKEKKLYDRSPINFLDRLSCPVIVFQGLEDKVVPPNQARLIYNAVKAKGIPVALIEYEGEQHGFLKVSHTFSCFLLCLNCAQKGDSAYVSSTASVLCISLNVVVPAPVCARFSSSMLQPFSMASQ